jgi:hypothetical protein
VSEQSDLAVFYEISAATVSPRRTRLSDGSCSQ